MENPLRSPGLTPLSTEERSAAIGFLSDGLANSRRTGGPLIRVLPPNKLLVEPREKDPRDTDPCDKEPRGKEPRDNEPCAKDPRDNEPGARDPRDNEPLDKEEEPGEDREDGRVGNDWYDWDELGTGSDVSGGAAWGRRLSSAGVNSTS